MSYLIFFLLLASFSTIIGIDVSGENSIIDAGQKLLEYAFLKKGGGIVGAIISIPTYKLSNLMVYKLILLILSLIFLCISCLLYTSPSPRDVEESRMPSSAWKKKK